MKRFENILAIYNDAVGDDNALTQATAIAICIWLVVLEIELVDRI